MTEYDDGRVIDKDELLEKALNFIDLLQIHVQLIAYGAVNDKEIMTAEDNEWPERRLAHKLDKEIQDWKEETLI
tara:strand:- start:265 stop:486 length:222 start_codon:yes stop_codon:yes gene_type:complete